MRSLRFKTHHLRGKLTEQALSSADGFTKDVGSRPDFVNKADGLAGKEGHRFNVSGCKCVWGHTDEPLNRHLCAGNNRSSNNGFFRPGILRLAFAIDPFTDECGSQSSVRSMGPSMSEQNGTHSVFLAGGHKPGLVDGMGIRFRSGEEA